MNKEEILKSLYKVRYISSSGYKFPVISEKNQPLIEECLTKLYVEENSKIAELEAKIYVYESVIANSNFRMVIEDERRKYEENSYRAPEVQEYLCETATDQENI